jgi:SecD/SecF fusion protein
MYRAQGGTRPVTTSSLRTAIDIMRTRVEQLGVSPASIRGVGSDEIEVVLPEGNSASTAEAVGKTGQLYFYDWEPNVIGRSGQPEPTEGTVTGDATSDGPGGVVAGFVEYQALLRAAKRPVILRRTDTTWSPGCTPRQTGGCLYGSWYLLDTAHEKVLRGPEDTKQELYADGYKPPAGAKPRALRVNPGTVLVQAHPVETADGRIINASPNSWYVLNDNPVLTGADLIEPEQSKDEFTGQPDVIFSFTAYGKAAFERVTKEIAHRGQEARVPGVSKEAALQHFAVVLDNQVITVPSIDYTKYPEGINASTGSEISGGFTIASAQSLSNELQSGALPIRLELLSRLRVPTASSDRNA